MKSWQSHRNDPRFSEATVKPSDRKSVGMGRGPQNKGSVTKRGNTKVSDSPMNYGEGSGCKLASYNNRRAQHGK